MAKLRVFVDFWNIAHMAWYPAVEAHNSNPDRYELVPIFKNNIELKLRTISDVLLKSGMYETEFVFVKDENSVRKILLYPKYKETRGISDIPMADAITHIKQKDDGPFCCSPDNEADDAICALVMQSGGGVAVSTDKDLWQLIGYTNAHVINPYTKSFVRMQDLYKAFSYTSNKCLIGLEDPRHIPLHKALWGDMGDCVPNAVPRMQKHLFPILKECDGTLEDFSQRVRDSWGFMSSKCRELYSENEEQIKINYDLVKLDPTCSIVWD